MSDLIENVALVTGGPKGLRAATRRLVQDGAHLVGAHVLIVGRDEAAATKPIATLDPGRRLLPLPMSPAIS